jgi:hypothetical protein
MSDVPRRLRPTAAQRARTILTRTKSAPSAQGSTGAARPVAERSRSQVYQPPATLEVIVGNTTDQTESVAITATIGGAAGSTATGTHAVAVGRGAYSNVLEGTTVGYNSQATGDHASALGANTTADAAGSVAIGCDSTGEGAATATDNVIKLGTALHTTIVLGNLVITEDGSGDLYRLAVVAGTLTAVPYP